MANSFQFSEQLGAKYNSLSFSPGTFVGHRILPACPRRCTQGMKTGESRFQGKKHGRQVHSHGVSAHTVSREGLITCYKATGDSGHNILVFDRRYLNVEGRIGQWKGE